MNITPPTRIDFPIPVDDPIELQVHLHSIGWIKWKVGHGPGGLLTGGLINATGLFVQLIDLPARSGQRQWVVRAGGKFRSYFDMISEPTYSDNHRDLSPPNKGGWKVTKYKNSVWNKRFAHLVWPTVDIVATLVGIARISDTEYADSLIVQIERSITRLNDDGMWQAVFMKRCPDCREWLTIWEQKAANCSFCDVPNIVQGD